MIDLFSILLTHGLMLVVIWRLIQRPDLNPGAGPPTATGLPPGDERDQAGHKRGWRRDDA